MYRTFLYFLKSEEGNVETGLVMIPVMLLFLSVLQLPTSALARVAYSAKLQSDTYLESFIGTPQSSANYGNQSNVNQQNGYQLRTNYDVTEVLPMPGGGEIVIKNRRIITPPVTPLLVGGDQFNSVGISVNENN